MLRNKGHMPIYHETWSHIVFIMGGPRVFLGHLWLYPRKTVPECSGTGIYGYGYRVWLGSHVPEGIVGYGISRHEGIRIWIKQ